MPLSSAKNSCEITLRLFRVILWTHQSWRRECRGYFNIEMGCREICCLVIGFILERFLSLISNIESESGCELDTTYKGSGRGPFRDSILSFVREDWREEGINKARIAFVLTSFVSGKSQMWGRSTKHCFTDIWLRKVELYEVARDSVPWPAFMMIMMYRNFS